MKHIEVLSILFLTSAPGPHHNRYLNSNYSLRMFEQLPEDVGREDYLLWVKNSPHPNAVAARSEDTTGQHVKTQLRCTLPTKPVVRVPIFLHINRFTHLINTLRRSCNCLVCCSWFCINLHHLLCIYCCTLNSCCTLNVSNEDSGFACY